MSQIGQTQVNFNTLGGSAQATYMARAMIIGIAQRGPIYKPVGISSVNSFLKVFGQPTNKYEFDFFQAVKSVVNAGGIAICYRIPYYAKDRNIFNSKFEYYVTDASKIIKSDYVLKDYNYDDSNPDLNGYYMLFVNERQELTDNLGFFIQRISQRSAISYFVLRLEDSSDCYRLYVTDGKMYVVKTTDPEDIDNPKEYLELTVNIDGLPTKCGVMLKQKTSGGIGLYLEVLMQDRGTREVVGSVDVVENDIVFDAVYKKRAEAFPENLPGAKLTFTPINDFYSALKIVKHIKENNSSVLVPELRADCFSSNELDTEPSQILGIFPVLFGPKDAENLRNINLENLWFNDPDNKLGFEAYTCNESAPAYSISFERIKNILGEFEYSPHFRSDWMAYEIGKLIDAYVPQDVNECKNTLGVAFMALYLNDEHQIDYAVLESFYGMLGTSTNRFADLEELINQNSAFFHLDIEGSVKPDLFIRALDNTPDQIKSIIGMSSWTIPMISPFTPGCIYEVEEHDDEIRSEAIEETIEHKISVPDVFAQEPSGNFASGLCWSFPQLYSKLSTIDFTNSSPFDYVLASGFSDILMYKTTSDGIIDIDEPIEIDNVDDYSYANVRKLYYQMDLMTSIGDKGIICLVDVPKVLNEYFKDNIKNCYNETQIKSLISQLDGIFSSNSSIKNAYNQTYCLFNYQYVDKDELLTRYRKFAKPNDLEIVPGSALVVGAYVYESNIGDFSPIAGPRSVGLFTECHKSYVENDLRLFKMLYDLYEITSLMNDRDNGTFPIQQTFSKNSYSVLNQLHAFRTYVSIRRQAYSIAKSFLYEPNTEIIRDNLQDQLTYLLSQYKKAFYINNSSYARVWADNNDIDQNQVNIEINVGIYGAIVKIIVNLNLTEMKIEVV